MVSIGKSLAETGTAKIRPGAWWLIEGHWDATGIISHEPYSPLSSLILYSVMITTY